MQLRNIRSVISVMVVLTMPIAVSGVSPAAQAPVHSKITTSQSQAKITAHEAKAIALKQFPGKVRGKVRLENEEGVWQYSVMIKSGKTLREVMVNAMTGKIDNVEVTTGATEKKEAAQEKAGAKSELQSKSSAKTK